MILFLELEECLDLIKDLGFTVKDVGLLDSAVMRPQATAFGEFAYPTFELMAAAMHQSLVKNHPLVDGNKRTAWLILNAFMRFNSYALLMTTEEGMDFTLGVAEGRYEIEQAAELIRTHLRAL
jgi:death-on-curing protein